MPGGAKRFDAGRKIGIKPLVMRIQECSLYVTKISRPPANPETCRGAGASTKT